MYTRSFQWQGRHHVLIILLRGCFRNGFKEKIHRRFSATTRLRSYPIGSNLAVGPYVAPSAVRPRDSHLFESRNPDSIGSDELSKSEFCENSSFETSEFLISRYQNSCSSTDARKLHLQIVKDGFTRDVVLCNTLINIYVRIGNLVLAREFFDEIPERNAVTWASLICGYAKNGMPTESCLHFRRMLRDGALPSQFAFGGAVRACQESRPPNMKLGMQIHGFISKTRYGSESVVGNSLISMYGNCSSSIHDAHRVFDEMLVKNSISWNSLISVYSNRGFVVSAFELFSSMLREGFGFSLRPNEYTFGSIITAACRLADSCPILLEQVLAMVKKSGFVQNLFVGSALVSGFSNIGSVDYALDIFEQMSERNAVSVNGLMVGLVRQKRGEKATGIFTCTNDLVGTNLDSYVVLLSSFVEFSDLGIGKQRGREVHAYVIRTGWIDMKTAIGNGIVNMYAKCGAIAYARSVFNLMIDKDSVSWNTMISGFDQSGCFEDAALTFSEMRRFGLTPTIFSLISSLSSCASLRWSLLGKQIHCDALKLGLYLDVSVSNTLLYLYAETGSLKDCRKVFFEMPEYDKISWNSIIGALADSDDSVLESVQHFVDMMRAGWGPNRVTYIHILGAASSLPLSKLALQIHALVLKHSFATDIVIENALLACYGKSGEINNCEEIFSKMEDKRDEVSWNSMISGYIHNGFLPKAMDLVWLMTQRGRRMDSFTSATVLSACASVATLEHGMEIHASGIRACLECDVVVGSALVDMYAKCGRIDYASRFFESMPVRNRYSWNSMISGFARHGHGDKALKLFTRMRQQGQAPDHVTYVGVLSACSHVGLVDEGFRHFKSMSEVYGLAPKMEHYSCIVDLLGRAGKLDRIEDFINKMPFQPNALIWRTALGACCRANGRKSELGQKAADMLFQLEPQNSANYVLLANMYAGGDKWENVAKVRAAMRKAAVKKEAGCSWVTMADGVHVFAAGDTSHPEKESIYDKLKELSGKMRDSGYVPETRFALYDLDAENKEEVLSYHSEKLAVAFVLTRKSELPIRIMKNLRVCGDCHSAFKYISKIVSRKIVLRDTNRFHHFNDGQCSCGDYW